MSDYIASKLTTNSNEDLGYLLYQSVKGVGNFDEFCRLITRGANVNYRYKPDVYGYTPLHIAAYSAETRKIRTLVSVGANINARDAYGRTPLDIALNQVNYDEVVDCLKKLGGKTGAQLDKSVDGLLVNAKRVADAINKRFSGKENSELEK